MGHARNYLTSDIIRRVLEDYFGFNVFLVMNVTDVDDKIILKARRAFHLQRYKDSRVAPDEVGSSCDCMLPQSNVLTHGSAAANGGVALWCNNTPRLDGCCLSVATITDPVHGVSRGAAMQQGLRGTGAQGACLPTVQHQSHAVLQVRDRADSALQSSLQRQQEAAQRIEGEVQAAEAKAAERADSVSVPAEVTGIKYT